MESSKIVPAIVVVLFVLCAAVAFVAFAFNTLGMEIPFVKEVRIPQIGTVLLYITFVLALVIFSLSLAYWIAKSIEGDVFRFMDRQLLPKKGKGNSHTTIYGERLERVVPPSFEATTVWELITQTLPGIFVISGVFHGTAVGIAKFSGPFPVAVGFFVLALLVNVTVIPWAYWLKEWRRRHTTFIVFTFTTYYVKVRTPILSLLSGLGTLPIASKTPIKQILEVQSAADPEDFDPTFKTSWIRDQFTSWVAKRKGLGTIFLRSISQKAEDILLWVDHAPGLQNILERLIENAALQASEQSFIAEEAVRKKVGDPDQEDWSRGKTEKEAFLYLEKFKGIRSPGIKYDLFRVEDPGLYDEDGNLLRNSPTEAPNEAKSDDVNVAHLFPSRNRMYGEPDLTEGEDPEKDRLP
ncbi:MAG: hypothetical protein UV31_C0008G0010 [candidate division WWE3 bacterium GW2011_GWF1_42_51]|uniref:Uncharacterized protein n=3 Tax=Katanobacteria TaxID=422282 RepID=A0A1F4XEE2_UNCKA|nr:MAG: hypothetical protein UU59_C0010G0013 [candidate division WWE3 bacterium GW2011_GWE1_41_27]KKS60612.1 MAG: hypothetical protein UV26_C0003G0066 [candidate division WWE3 bacterium GW2011_GWF2_42_42]KKS63546.1 MAG: hypothetical protein UV31_C0008G0010 [candidate division WWE3 bacterium GW2011_GWF1_42_51]OGC80039.1 MAG: hypothetical protein A3K01_02495 [candidate division WWE3 bacterium RIFOXYD1_FULL_43_17]